MKQKIVCVSPDELVPIQKLLDDGFVIKKLKPVADENKIRCFIYLVKEEKAYIDKHICIDQVQSTSGRLNHYD